MKKIVLSVVIMLSLLACKKDTTITTDSTSYLTVEFDNVVGDRNLELGARQYKTALGDSFSVDVLKYFVSNFKLTNENNVEYTVPQDSCYFLVDESIAASQKVKIKMPVGNYKKLSFVLGVDSLRNTKPVEQRTGALDVAGTASGMYWTWNSGYIFFKMEGKHSFNTVKDSSYMYHIGLFGGLNTPTLNNIKTINIDLTAAGIAQIKAGRVSNIHLLTDVLKVFNGDAEKINIKQNQNIMASAKSAVIANNYATMFTHGHTEN